MTDVLVVGAGAASLFAVKEIAEKSKLKLLIVDMGREVDKRKCHMTEFKTCTECNPCNIMCGVGGAGTLSSGLLNLRPDIGGNLYDLVDNREDAWNLIDHVHKTFLTYGAPEKLYKPTKKESESLQRKAAAIGVKFIPIPQLHIGSDNAPDVIKKFKTDLEKKGVKFKLNTRITSIDSGQATLKDGTKITAKYLLIAPGRSGADWLASEAKRLKINTRYQPIDIGVRIEVPAVIMDPVIKIGQDPKFHIYPDTYDDFVRTFCVNHRGFVVQEVYDDFIGVNGHAMANKKTDNTNFALLVKVELTEPLEDTTSYGRTISTQATTLGGGKPLIQRLGDLKSGHRSTWDRVKRGNVSQTLMNVTPGDISMALPHRIVTDILEALNKLDYVIPGVSSPATLIYAPEIKFSANRIITKKTFETSCENVFVAGDGAGLSNGLVTASATGVLAARGILSKEGLEPKT